MDVFHLQFTKFTYLYWLPPVLEHCDDESTQNAMMEEIMQSVVPLIQDQYANDIIQVSAYSFAC